MMLKYIKYLFGLFLVGLLAGCVSDFDQPDLVATDTDFVEVDIDLQFGSDWTIDIGETRAAPPGSGGNNDPDMKVDGYEDMDEVDQVRVLAFKRRENSTNSFVYDVLNDQILDVDDVPQLGSDGKPQNHLHKVAHGKLKKVYGFEYRVIALAYASGKPNLYKDIRRDDDCTFFMPDGEQNWFNINTDQEPTFEEVMAKLDFATIPNNAKRSDWRDFIKYNGPSFDDFLGIDWDIVDYEEKVGPLSRNVVQVPQLFYGTLQSETGSEIIGYSETLDNGDIVNDLKLTGILYRGVAKLEIKLKVTKPTTKLGTIYDFDYYRWVALMASDVTTDVNLSSYDGFLSPVKNGLNSGYTAVNYVKLDDSSNNNNIGQEVTFTTWFLPTRTKLALRLKSQRDGLNSLWNFQIKTKDVFSTGNGTGVMSPDIVDGVFYFRRNHKYMLEIDLDKLLNSSYRL